MLDRDLDLVAAIAIFIASYRAAGEPAARMQEAVLATFPRANSSDYACGLVRANLLAADD